MLKCVQGCCRVCPWVLQNVCRVTELSNIFSNFSKIFFGAKKYFKQKVATQAKSQRGLKIIHRLVQSLWSLIQSYLVVPGGAGATKSSAQDGFWPDIALWTLWPIVHCSLLLHSPTGLSRSSKENLGAAGHVVVTLFFE